MTSVRKAIFITLGQRYTAFLIQFLTSLILARLLSPTETGVFSLAAAVVAIGHMLRDFGVGEYIIQEKNLTLDKIRAAYALTITMSWTIALCLVLLAKPLAGAYEEPGVAKVLYILAINFMLLPIGSTAFAVLSKNLEFGKIFVVQLAANLIGATTTITCAFNGMSYLSPALGSIAGILTTVIGLIIVSPQNTLILPSFTRMRMVAKFGGILTAGRLIDQSSNRAPDFIVSAFLGFHDAGLLSKASSLLSAFSDFIGSAVLSVAAPALARSGKAANELKHDYYLAIPLLGLMQWLFFGFVMLFSDEIIRVLFGSQWLEAIPIMQIGAISGLVWVPFMLYSPILTALGEAKKQLFIQLIGAPALLAATLVGALFSLKVVVALSLLSLFVRLWAVHRILQKTINFSLVEVGIALKITAVICSLSLLAGLIVKLLAIQVLDFGPLVTLILAGITTIACALPLIRFGKHPAWSEIKIIQDKLKTMVSPRSV